MPFWGNENHPKKSSSIFQTHKALTTRKKSEKTKDPKLRQWVTNIDTQVCTHKRIKQVDTQTNWWIDRHTYREGLTYMSLNNQYEQKLNDGPKYLLT